MSRARVGSGAGLFGYENETASPIELPAGLDNRLDGAPIGAPTTVFAPGLTPYAFYGYFDPSQGSATWSILGTPATAHDGSTRCTAADVLPPPPGQADIPIDAPGEPSDAAKARAVPNYYGRGYSTVPLPTGPFSSTTVDRRTLSADSGARFRIRVTNVGRGSDGCGTNDPVFRSVLIGGHEVGPRDLQQCSDRGDCDELFEAPLDLAAPEVKVVFDVWDADDFLCGADDHQFRARLAFDAVSGAHLGGSLEGFDPHESGLISAGSNCVRTSDGDGFCWTVEVVRPTEICFQWPADFVDAGPWGDGSAEDFFAARGVQAFPATRALAEVVLMDESRMRYKFDGILDHRGCVPSDRLPAPSDWAREDGFRATFRLLPVMCGDPSGAQCAKSFSMTHGPANIVVAERASEGRPAFCTAFVERPTDTLLACRTVSAFDAWPTGSGPPLLELNAHQVGTEDSLTPTTRVAAVVGQAIRRDAETGGDLSIALGLVERRYADGTPTIYANQACPIYPDTACASRNLLYLEPDFVQRPGVFGSNRYKFVVGHELGHFFQYSSQGSLAVNYKVDDVNPLCSCRHVPEVDRLHCMQSLEAGTSAQSEGWGHFLAAKMWNRTEDPDCTFAYYKEFLDRECRPGAEQCLPDPDHPELSRTLPPFPLSCTSRARWRNTQCLDATATPDKLGQGVELDWLAFYWGINSAPDIERWSTREIHDVYVHACGGQPCKSAPVTWAQLQASSEVVASETQARLFALVGRDARVDDEP